MAYIRPALLQAADASSGAAVTTTARCLLSSNGSTEADLPEVKFVPTAEQYALRDNERVRQSYISKGLSELRANMMIRR